MMQTVTEVANCIAMKIFLVFLGLLIHHACAQFTFGFGLKEYCAVEGDDYQYCIVVVNGVAPPGGFNIIVDTTVGDTTTQEIITIPGGFNSSQPPICRTGTTEENDCLDDGSVIGLEIKIDDNPPPAGVSIADGCGQSHVRVIDDEVIEYDVSEDVTDVDEGTTSVTVCIILSCVEGPTKRCAPVLFHVDPIEGMVKRQKKIAVIPTGILDNGTVCCDIELEDFDVAEDEYVDVPYNVKSEDLNVKGDAEGIIRVHGINDECLDPFFENDTPSVTGDTVSIDLSDCVTQATCQLRGVGSPVDCASNAGNTASITTGRNTRLLLEIIISGPQPRTISRRIRMDMATEQCDSHLVDRGITKAIDEIDNAYTMEFEGTGPNLGNLLTTFSCTVFSPSGTDIVALTSCSPPTYTFVIPAGTTNFYVEVEPNPPQPNPAVCERTHIRTFHYPVPLEED